MNHYTNQIKLENLVQEANNHALLEPLRFARAKNLRRAFKAAKFAIRTAWAALTSAHLEPHRI